MLPDRTGFNFEEVIEVIDNYIATGPPFFTIVENWSTRMVVALIVLLGLLVILLKTSFVGAFVFIVLSEVDNHFGFFFLLF